MIAIMLVSNQWQILQRPTFVIFPTIIDFPVASLTMTKKKKQRATLNLHGAPIRAKK